MTAHRVTCLECAIGKYFKNAATHKQQKNEPGRAGNLLFACWPCRHGVLSVACRIYRKEPQLNSQMLRSAENN